MRFAAAELDRIETALGGGFVDQALDDVVRLGLAGAAVGVERGGVGEDAAHVHEDGGDDVAAAHGRGGGVGGAAGTAGGHVGAEAGDGANIQRQERSVGVQCETGVGHVVPPLGGGEKSSARSSTHLIGRPR